MAEGGAPRPLQLVRPVDGFTRFETVAEALAALRLLPGPLAREQPPPPEPPARGRFAGPEHLSGVRHAQERRLQGFLWEHPELQEMVGIVSVPETSYLVSHLFPEPTLRQDILEASVSDGMRKKLKSLMQAVDSAERLDDGWESLVFTKGSLMTVASMPPESMKYGRYQGYLLRDRSVESKMEAEIVLHGTCDGPANGFEVRLPCDFAEDGRFHRPPQKWHVDGGLGQVLLSHFMKLDLQGVALPSGNWHRFLQEYKSHIERRGNVASARGRLQSFITTAEHFRLDRLWDVRTPEQTMFIKCFVSGTWIAVHGLRGQSVKHALDHWDDAYLQVAPPDFFESVILALADIAENDEATRELKRVVFPHAQEDLDRIYGEGAKDVASSFELIPFLPGTALVFINEMMLHAGPGLRFVDWRDNSRVLWRTYIDLQFRTHPQTSHTSQTSQDPSTSSALTSRPSAGSRTDLIELAPVWGALES